MSRGARVRATKSPERRAARAGWHSFGEYALLEDSRYASQRQNVRRNRGFGDAGWQCFWRATIANIFRARRLLPSLAALAHTALRIVGMRRRRLTERPPRARLGAKWGRRDRVCGTAFGRAAWQAGPLRRRLRSLRRSRRRTKSGELLDSRIVREPRSGGVAARLLPRVDLLPHLDVGRQRGRARPLDQDWTGRGRGKRERNLDLT